MRIAETGHQRVHSDLCGGGSRDHTLTGCILRQRSSRGKNDAKKLGRATHMSLDARWPFPGRACACGAASVDHPEGRDDLLRFPATLLCVRRALLCKTRMCSKCALVRPRNTRSNGSYFTIAWHAGIGDALRTECQKLDCHDRHHLFVESHCRAAPNGIAHSLGSEGAALPSQHQS